MKKIISIISFSPKHDNILQRFKNFYEYTDYYRKNIGKLDFLDVNEDGLNRVFFYEEFAHNQAERLAPKLKDTTIELWRPYLGIKKLYSKEINGVNHKLFPAINKLDVFGRKILKSDYMINELNHEITSNILLIINYPSNFTSYLLSQTKPYNTPIIANKRGFWFQKFKDINMISMKFLYHLYKVKKEEYCLNNFIDYFGSVSIRSEERYLNDLNYNNYFYHQDGVDFTMFKPSKNKIDLKKSLNIPINNNIILYIGRFYENKGAKFLIDIYNNMNKDKNTLIMIGGKKTEQLYDLAKNSGVIILEKIPRGNLKKYYQIADVFTMPILKPSKIRTYGGMGRSTIEALASGVPVLTDQLIHFEGSDEECLRVGRLIKDKKSFLSSLEYILNNKEQYKNCRDIAKKYYDLNICNQRLLKYINLLYKEYNL